MPSSFLGLEIPVARILADNVGSLLFSLQILAFLQRIKAASLCKLIIQTPAQNACNFLQDFAMLIAGLEGLRSPGP
jgi:hypothetical protein